jgi:hypothetical protein
MVRSFLALSRTDPGFDPRHVWTLRVNGGRQGARPEENAAIVRQIHGALAAIPGVEAVTAANVLPLTGNYFPYRWGTAEAEHDESRYQAFDVETVLPGYFATMHTPIVAGREFDESDNHPGLNRIIVMTCWPPKHFLTATQGASGSSADFAPSAPNGMRCCGRFLGSSVRGRLGPPHTRRPGWVCRRRARGIGAPGPHASGHGPGDDGRCDSALAD